MNRRRSRSGSAKLAGAVVLVLAASLFAESRDAGAQAPPDQTAWNALAEQYTQDPVGTREQLLRESSGRIDQLKPIELLFVADAYLRGDDVAAATRLLNRVIEEAPAEFYTSYAYAGLGLIDVRSGDLSRARTAFQKAMELSANGPDEISQLSTLMSGQTAAAMGNYDEALEVLGALADKSDARTGIRSAASFARASTLLAAGRDEEAAAAFDQLAAVGGSMATDARYAAARARLEAGDGVDAREALEGLVTGCPPESSGRRVSRQLRDLTPEAVMLAWIRNYKEQPFDSFEAGSAAVFSVQGCDLARSTLARLEREGAPAAAPAEPAVPPATPPAAETAPSASPASTTGPVPAAASGPASSGTPVAVLFLGAAAILLVLAWLWRRG